MMIKGSIAFVTGASSGIGEATRLARVGREKGLWSEAAWDAIVDFLGTRLRRGGRSQSVPSQKVNT